MVRARALRALPGHHVPAEVLALGMAPPTHRSGPHVSPPGSPALVPAMPQQGWSPAPHSPVLPGHGPCGAAPTHAPTSRPVLIPSQWRCPMPGAGAAPVPRLPCSWLGQWDSPWLPDPALTDAGEPPLLPDLSPRELLSPTAA